MHILYNARIYTQNPSQPMADALAIENGRIIACGRKQDVLAYQVPGTVLEDSLGAFIMPGITDAHVHLEYYANALINIDCETNSRQECLDRVAARAKTTPPGEWILGHGWNQHTWLEGFGNAKLLDEVAPHNPVYLTAKSLHAGWCNSLALQRMGADSHTPDPVDGRYGRDAQGNPDGILYESAMGLIDPFLPPKTPERTAAAIKVAQQQLWQYGITGVHDFDGVRCFQALQLLLKQDALHIRVTKSIPLEALPHAAGVGLQTGFGNDMLRIGALKLFADGALGPRTAAMLDEYENDPGNTGMLFLDQEQVFEYGMQAARAGLSLSVHAIGDRANHEVLNGLENLRKFEKENNLPHLRHRIEHVQVLHPDDITRLGKLGVVASVQPIHVPSDMKAADRWWGDRSAYAYAFRSLLNSGTQIALGSDTPVESPNPFWGLHAVTTRTCADGSPSEESWYPQQKLSMAQAIEGFTTGGAYITDMESRLGRLAPGYLADLVMLPHSLFDISARELREILPLATMVDGMWVWQRTG